MVCDVDENLLMAQIELKAFVNFALSRRQGLLNDPLEVGELGLCFREPARKALIS